MVKLANRVKVSTATTGTGTITLGSAEAGYRTLNIDDDDFGIYPYVVEDGDDYEVGEGIIYIGGKVDGELDVSSQIAVFPYDLKFKPDGTELYVLDQYNVRQYTLSTAWDLTSASYTASGALDNNSYNGLAIEFNDDGTLLFSCGTSGVEKYSLSTAWDITTLTGVATSTTLSYPYSLRFVNSGTELVTSRFSNWRKYSLTTAYDATTAGSYTDYNPSEAGYPYGFEFNSDGTQCFAVDGDIFNPYIRVFDCSTAYDISSASLTYAGLYAKMRDSGQLRGLFRKDDNTMFILAKEDDGTALVQKITKGGIHLARGLIESSTGSLLNLSGSAKTFISANSNLMHFQSEWMGDPTTSNYKGNLPIGKNALISITSGYDNIAIGQNAGRNLTTASDSIAIGADALSSNTTNSRNIAVGIDALRYATGYNNTAFGNQAGDTITTNSQNVCVGAYSDVTNVVGNTVAVGTNARATGTGTISIGYDTGNGNAAASDYNVNVGYNTSRLSGGGDYNVNIGYQNAFLYYQTASYNVNVGYQSSYRENIGSLNVNIGAYSNHYGESNDNSVNVGAYAGRYSYSNDNCTNIGYYTGNYSSNMSGSYNTSIGAYAQPSSTTVSGQFTLGNGSVTNLRCNDTSISTLSDERDKTNIQDIPYGLDFINDVRPVTFHWNRRDGTMANLKDVGFIAQDLADVELEYSSGKYTRLVDFENPEKLEARPQAMFPILVKAVQELSQKNDALEARIAALEGN